MSDKKLPYVQIRACTIQAMTDLEPEEIAEAMWALAGYLKDGDEDGHMPEKREARLMYRLMLDDVDRGRNLVKTRQEAAQRRWDKARAEQAAKAEQCGFLTEADAAQLMRDQSEVIDEAKRSGFRMVDAEKDQLIDLLSTYGKEKVLMALGEAVSHNATAIAYVRKVLESTRREEAKQEGKPPELTQTIVFN